MTVLWTTEGESAIVNDGRLDSYAFVLMGALVLLPLVFLSTLLIQRAVTTLDLKASRSTSRSPAILLSSRHLTEEMSRTRTVGPIFRLGVPFIVFVHGRLWHGRGEHRELLQLSFRGL